ncbi:beta-galactosidase [Cohnella nanjingensis]|uniref:Beta-galactosidase n=1 Tax=Cohnella nanjingensis TaxID=1387779 RepID=A0A7X0RZY1_9BACL|nr:beta-galactosidase [Cohnella nanjingensis]MBB6675616.1 beta-galactosidase [Cohnella nanjingensis]
MERETSVDQAVRLAPDRVTVNGRSVILLCASLFYFRIPRALWRERMEQLKAFGYNAIDVYFPWNHHESSEGEWDFEGERDAAAFLDTAKDVGLWVVARPGPYICSEWDGGALPAYLLAQADVRLRDNDPAYLRHVARWFDRILPILRAYQAGAGGTIVCVQLENELDFYGCSDPHGYVSALRDLAHERGIAVPLVACAGQGGLYGSSGYAEDVVPACNFYPYDRDPDFESKVLSYQARLAEGGHPLLVTETNRNHFLLRRLLSCGAKLLGPYLQVSGTDFGFTNATNNWGEPLAFMTSDYDFGGMISPEGHVRAEAYEGRLLRRILNAYGSALAEASPVGTGETPPGSGIADPAAAGQYRLALAGGGSLLFVSNPGETAVETQLSLSSTSEETRSSKDDSNEEAQLTKDDPTEEPLILSVPPGRCLLLPMRVPMAKWGVPGTLDYATAELADAAQGAAKTILVFHTEGEAEVRLKFDEEFAFVQPDGMTVREAGASLALRFDGCAASGCVIGLRGGRLLEIVALPRAEALLVESVDETAGVRRGPGPAPAPEPADAGIAWTAADQVPHLPMAAESAAIPKAEPLETHGIYRGFAWYEAETPATGGARPLGVLIRQGSDVVSLYADGRYLGTVTPGGSSRYMPLPEGGGARRLSARAEIWGHSNFDDIRLPALRLHAGKGLTDLVAVTRAREITSNWRLRRAAAENEASPLGADGPMATAAPAESAGPASSRAEYLPASKPNGGARVASSQAERQPVLPPALPSARPADDDPIVAFGGWMSPDQPAREIYRKTIFLSSGADSWTLHFDGLQATATVFVGGREAGQVTPFDPYLTLTPYLDPSATAQELSVLLERTMGLPAGRVMLLEGNAAVGWRLSAAQEAELLAHAAVVRPNAIAAALPLSLAPGGVAWAYGALPNSAEGRGWRIVADGENVKLTVFFAGRLVSRLWLPGGDARPAMKGGSPDSFYLPGVWFGEGAEDALTVLVEAVNASQAGLIRAFRLLPV